MIRQLPAFGGRIFRNYIRGAATITDVRTGSAERVDGDDTGQHLKLARNLDGVTICSPGHHCHRWGAFGQDRRRAGSKRHTCHLRLLLGAGPCTAESTLELSDGHCGVNDGRNVPARVERTPWRLRSGCWLSWLTKCVGRWRYQCRSGERWMRTRTIIMPRAEPSALPVPPSPPRP